MIGLKLAHRPEVFLNPGYWFEIGDIGFHIGIEPGLAHTSRHSAFEVSDIKEARRHLEQQGVAVHEEEVIPGRERFFFLDPFGTGWSYCRSFPFCKKIFQQVSGLIQVQIVLSSIYESSPSRHKEQNNIH